MFTLARDAKNDLYLDGNGQIATVQDTEATAQIVDARVKTLRGEMQLNVGRGIPYFATIMQSKRFLPYWEGEMRSVILQCPGVRDILSFRYSTSGENLSYLAQVRTTFGTETYVTANFTDSGKTN